MMELFIKIVGGQPFEHPMVGKNFRQAFPDVDVNNLPAEFARFERVAPPKIKYSQLAVGPVYQWVDGVVKDVWTIQDLEGAALAEKEQIQAEYLNSIHRRYLLVTQTLLAQETDPVAVQDLNSWIAALSTWTLTDYEKPGIPNASERLRQTYNLPLLP
jgi:hypothetical protein